MYVDARGVGASREEIFRSLETGEGIYKPTEEEFLTLLRSSGVDLATFNQRGRKSLETHYAESQREHIVCREEETGTSVRFARSGKLLITNPKTNVVWIEVGRGSPGKEPVLIDKDYTISETLLFGQTVRAGLVCGVKDELDIVANPAEFKTSRLLEFTERHRSSAYPDHDSIVRTYYMHWETDQLCEKMFGRALIFTDTGVSILLRSFPLLGNDAFAAGRL